ncbi:RNA dependent RNA polymerase-domain-containing protein [Mycena alexandri]|uniref:RNA-dependent RNA polymerase n=1 Tax=Mycena alexandri TaxID=1745969 RepID=A0AAD6SVB7_9AGAR|nr:RNA dependent RNA polymerase-domain-containing protein [Mycena alexandri]
MNTKSILAKKRLPFIRLLVDLKIDANQPNQVKHTVSHFVYHGHESRATRQVGDSMRFMTVAFTKGSTEHCMRIWLQAVTQPGESITFDGKKYVFVGFTESNLKAGHLLFFREGDDFNVETLLKAFGDLRPVYEASGYGKFAARLGMSFSSTVPTLEIKPADEIEIVDLIARDGSLTSDGSGLIRESTARESASSLGIPIDTAVFQVRRGGNKGTLTLCSDQLFDRLYGPDKKIAYRLSMVKYKGGPQTLEVQDISRPPKTGRLNKQFIVLLLTRGIPLTVFEELLQMQLDEIDKITTHREEALECVGGEIDAGASATDFGQPLYEMLLAGHDMNEPYLATLLRRFQNTSREALRSKLQIPVKASGYLFGVVDYCEVLKEGEVYINLPAKGGPQVGPVAVMRNPAYDPDGIRVLKAVNRPELKQLINCIVFAPSGAHSETDRMGGGDLDGDRYFVIFNPLLIPKSRPPPPPVDAPSPPRIKTVTIAGSTQTTSSPTMINRNTNIRSDAIETFITMRRSFLVGQISKQWSELVGATRELADLPQCRALVPLIETALDAVKNGGGLRRAKDEFFRAKKQITILQASADWGRLTANWQDPLQLLAERVPGKVSEEMEFIPNPQLILRSSTSEEEWQRLSLEAKQFMLEYNARLSSAIDADKEIRAYGWDEEKRADIFKAEFIAEHFPAIEKFNERIFDAPKYWLKASVWYSVGYENRKQSFAWLGARHLNYIRTMSTGYLPIAVGAQSTPLVPPPKVPADNGEETATNTPQSSRSTSPDVANDTLAHQPMSREDSEDTLVDLDDDPDVPPVPGTLKPPMDSPPPSVTSSGQPEQMTTFVLLLLITLYAARFGL